METSPGTERRQSARVPFRAPIRVYEPRRDVLHDGTCFDLSFGGVGLQMAAVLQVGDIVELVLPGDEERYRHPAQVVHRGVPERYGLAFERQHTLFELVLIAIAIAQARSNGAWVQTPSPGLPN